MKTYFLGKYANGSSGIEDDALWYAFEKHAGQTDKAGEAYIDHVMRVADLVNRNPALRAIAYLHDVVEDTDATIAEIRDRFGYSISDAVDKLTRRENESYEDYIERLSASHDARIVKIADLVDNMNLSRLAVLSMKDVKRQRKYANALCALMEKECAE